MIDLNFYQWKERVNVDGVTRLLNPCRDPFIYETEIDFVFKTKQEAIDCIYEFNLDNTYYDPDTWVLVHYTGIGSNVRLPMLPDDCIGWVDEQGNIQHDDACCPHHEGDQK